MFGHAELFVATNRASVNFYILQTFLFKQRKILVVSILFFEEFKTLLPEIALIFSTLLKQMLKTGTPPKQSAANFILKGGLEGVGFIGLGAL